MNNFSFSERSKINMRGVHPDLIGIMYQSLLITKVDFTVIDGLRTKEQQEQNLISGASTTMHSRHLPNKKGLACAVDLVAWGDGQITWEPKFYIDISGAVKHAADTLGLTIEWGGDWHSFKDYGHYQLPWGQYP